MSQQTQDRLGSGERLASVLELIRRQQLVEQLVRHQHAAPRQDLAESLLRRQQDSELEARLAKLRPPDMAQLLEMLPPLERAAVWRLIPDQFGGDVLWALGEGVAAALIAETPEDRLIHLCDNLDGDELAHLAELLPEQVLNAARLQLDAHERSELETSIAYPYGSVGRLMSHEVLTVDVGWTIKQTLKMVRHLEDLPGLTDQLYVVDQRGRLVGELPVGALLRYRLRQTVSQLMEAEPVSLRPEDLADDAALEFEHYDLVSAPVVDSRGKLIGRLTVDAVMDHIRDEGIDDAMKRDGLSADEDLFGPIFSSARRRWPWLAVNLMTALVASRVIGVFEGTIEQLVVLATLMPIVASIGGNTGNQTVALAVRGLALRRIQRENVRYLLLKELGVGALNGLIWGLLIGTIAGALYQDLPLGLVMATATLLNLIIAAAAGVAAPLLVSRSGRDPAMGSSVLLTFTTDTMGFLIFLGLASLFLVG